VSRKKRRQAALANRPSAPHAPPLAPDLHAMLARTEFSFSQEVTRQVPEPAELAGYNDVVPGSAERFLREWETERAHQRALSLIQAEAIREEIRASAKDRRIGLWLGFLLGAGGLAGLVYMGIHGASWVGMAAVVLSLGSLVWAVRRSTAGIATEVPPEQVEEDEGGTAAR
jgi:uncharacterized membrane protein